MTSAARQSENGKTINVLIVDDEPLACRRLLKLCRNRPEIKSVDVAYSGDEAIDKVKQNTPDLLLLDIDMPDISGMEVADRCRSFEQPPQIVFTTAHSKYAAQAFRLKATDYLLKPVKAPLLLEALQRVLSVSSANDHSDNRESGEPDFVDHIWVRDGKGSIQIRFIDIERIEAEGDYMRLCLPGRSYLFHDALHALERKLPGNMFVRIHRSAMVRIDLIRDIRRDGRRSYLILTDKREMPIGPNYMKSVTQAFNQEGGLGLSDTVTE